MSCNYANGLSPYEHKGKLGLQEKFESKESVASKVEKLAKWIEAAKHVVVHTGAGISTSAGIPDFRGPNGVWTLEAQGKTPQINLSFNDAVPTKTHMALLKLIEKGKIQYIISQNIDGLHLRSGLPRKYLAELHGNMFVEQCNFCKRQFIRNSATTSVGQKNLGTNCPVSKINGRNCRGKMHDIILDWEHSLPERDLEMADYHSSLADLNLCLGTTLQINPSGNLPLKTKKYKNGKLVICNLQPTKHDRKADLIINSYVDDIMSLLLEHLDLKTDSHNPERDPTKSQRTGIVEWTIPDEEVKEAKKKYLELCNEVKRKMKDNDTEIPHEKKPKLVKKEIKLKSNEKFSKQKKSECADLNEIKVVVKDENVLDLPFGKPIKYVDVNGCERQCKYESDSEKSFKKDIKYDSCYEKKTQSIDMSESENHFKVQEECY